jgi:oligoribonuclease NrnB/cAMP/cGMP phosphodiesterase (DHH superfamily)
MDIVIFHDKCADGWAAAFIAKKKYPKAKLVGFDHGMPTPMDLIKDKEVLIADFSWSYDELKNMGYAAKSVIVLDHHRTAEQNLLKAVKELQQIREIPLSNGNKAYVDADDYDRISQYSWSEAKHGGATAYLGGGRLKPKYAYMHRMILEAPDNTLVDHKNRCTLDNRKSNLRLATKKQNAANMDRGSKKKGVTWNKANKKWVAQITVDYIMTYLGSFDTEDEAARVYDAAAVKAFGEFARGNFIESETPFPANVKIVFDMKRSGAGITWDELFGGTRPFYVNYVEDRDLWNWALPESKEINAYLMSLPMTIEAWSTLDNSSPRRAAELGRPVVSHIDRYVREIVEEAQFGTLHLDVAPGQYIHRTAAVVNCPYMNCSEVGNILAQQAEVSITWFERADGLTQFSLRSIGDIDVSEIAKAFLGGGHRNAAGFRLSTIKARNLIDTILGRDLVAYRFRNPNLGIKP